MSILGPIDFPPLPSLSSEGTLSLKKKELLVTEKNITHLQLSDDPRLHIGVETIKTTPTWRDQLKSGFDHVLKNHIEVEVENRKIIINIKNISSILHLKKEQIKEAAQQGHLMDLLKQQTEKMSAVMSSYDEIVDFTKKKSTSDLSPEILKKIFNLAFKIFNEPKSIYLPLKIAEHTYHLGVDKHTQKIKIVTIADEVLGKGSNSELRLLRDANTGQQEVIKLAAPLREGETEEQIRVEYQILNTVHQEGERYGIQAKPNQAIYIPSTLSSSLQYGYIGVKYDSDYATHISEKGESVEEHFSNFHQLLLGLKQLADLNILHGDLNPSNILVKTKPDGTKLVHLADFGGARVVKADTSMEQLSKTGFTPAYTSEEDLALFKIYLKDGEKEKFVELEKARDVFSLGGILQFALTQKLSYPNSRKGFPIFFDKENSLYRPIRQFRDDISIEIATLIQEMQDPDYTKRPTAGEAFERFNTYLKTEKSELYKEIQKVQKEYSGTPA